MDGALSMRDFSLAWDRSLDWQHCPDGVELFDYGPAPERVMRRVEKLSLFGLPTGEYEERLVRPTILTTPPSGMVFRCKSERRHPIKLTADLSDPLILRFINASDDVARAEFLAQHGFFYHREEWERDDLQREQGALTTLLTMAGSGSPDLAQLYINENLRPALFQPQLDGNRLHFRVRSLFALLLREIILVAENDARFTRCERCQVAF